MKQKNKIILLFIAILSVGMTSCASVRGYQKMYLNDQEMALESRKLDFFETNFHTYREGASGSNGGKVGGGCGCN